MAIGAGEEFLSCGLVRRASTKSVSFEWEEAPGRGLPFGYRVRNGRLDSCVGSIRGGVAGATTIGVGLGTAGCGAGVLSGEMDTGAMGGAIMGVTGAAVSGDFAGAGPDSAGCLIVVAGAAVGAFGAIGQAAARRLFDCWLVPETPG